MPKNHKVVRKPMPVPCPTAQERFTFRFIHCFKQMKHCEMRTELLNAQLRNLWKDKMSAPGGGYVADPRYQRTETKLIDKANRNMMRYIHWKQKRNARVWQYLVKYKHVTRVYFDN